MPISSIHPVVNNEPSFALKYKNFLIKTSEETTHFWGCLYMNLPTGGVNIYYSQKIKKEEKQTFFPFDISFIFSKELRYCLRAYKEVDGEFILVEIKEGKASDLAKITEIALSPVLQ